jgi:hypothetical protein
MRTLADSEVPDTLGSGAHRVLSGYDISWGDVTLAKAATLEMSYHEARAAKLQLEGTPSLHFSGPDSTWQRIGGTEDADQATISCPLTTAGRYALFLDPADVGGAASLSPLSMTPRVFSPEGSFAADEVAISFELGRSAPVTVRVYNRAGRLVREVVSGHPMGAGANLVRWNGRDTEGEIVPDGLYLVTVEALGKKQTRILGVVR